MDSRLVGASPRKTHSERENKVWWSEGGQSWGLAQSTERALSAFRTSKNSAPCDVWLERREGIGVPGDDRVE